MLVPRPRVPLNAIYHSCNESHSVVLMRHEQITVSELHGFVFSDFANIASVWAVHFMVICMMFVKDNIA